MGRVGNGKAYLRGCASVGLTLGLLLGGPPAAAQYQDPPVAETSDDLDALEQAKKLYEAQKAASDAATAAWNSKKAESEAEVAAIKAGMGSIQGQSEIKGVVQAGATPPKAEALLLVTSSAIEAGRMIADRIAPDLQTNTAKEVLVLTDKAQLSTADALIFDLQADQLRHAARANQARFAHCPVPAKAAAPGSRGGRGAAFATAAGAAVDLLSKFGSYFMTDYTYGEVTVDLSPDILAAAVVQNFEGWTNGPKFVVPNRSLVTDPAMLMLLLQPLQDDYVEAVANREIATEYAKGHGDAAKDKAAACTASAVAYGKSIAGFETLMTSLAANGSGTEPFGVRVARQKMVQAKLAADPLVLLLNTRPVAAYYTKKNLWTFLGGMPLYTMGGTAATYTLFHPRTGHLLKDGTVKHHGGYRSLNRVERLVNAGNPTTTTAPSAKASANAR